MNKLKKIFTIFLFLILIYILFRYNYLLNTAVINAVNLWLTKVFPSLFIMFILNDIIIHTNVLEPLNKLINPLFNKIFKTSGNSSQAFLLCLFSGTPSSAFILKEMYKKQDITLNDANKLIAFTYFSNPLFLYSILSLSFNKYITLKIILIHYLANLLIGLIFASRNSASNLDTKTKDVKSNFLVIIPDAISKSFNTLLVILGTITFYMIITTILTTIIKLNPPLDILFKGTLEITQALNALPLLNKTSIIKEIIALQIISFGGISIHTQILSIISDTNISYKNFFFGRLWHVLISTIAYLFIYYISSC